MTSSYSATVTGPMFLWCSTNSSWNLPKAYLLRLCRGRSELWSNPMRSDTAQKVSTTVQDSKCCWQKCKQYIMTTLTQAQLLIGLLTGRKLKMSTIQQVESTAMEIEDTRMPLKCVTMENLAQFPADRLYSRKAWMSLGTAARALESRPQINLVSCPAHVHLPVWEGWVWARD